MGRRKRRVDKDADLTFELTDEHLIGEYGTEINLILGVLGQIDYDLAQAIVTDDSKFSDFDLSDEELDEISTELGVNVNHIDLLTSVAGKMRNED